MPGLWGHSELAQSHFNMTTLQLFSKQFLVPLEAFLLLSKHLQFLPCAPEAENQASCDSMALEDRI